jgi:hypothetical protein
VWWERAKHPQSVEYIVVVNEDDPGSLPPAGLEPGFGNTQIVIPEVSTSPAAWNVGANHATGKLLIQGSDDFYPPQDWDELLLKRVEQNGTLDDPMFLAVSDGYRKDGLCPMAIMTRARRDAEGFFLWPGYVSLFSDDEVTLRAKRAHRDGECKFIEARDLVFRHEHHSHNPSVPHDLTYAKQNAPEAYTQGLRLFKERNPRALEDPLKNW